MSSGGRSVVDDVIEREASCLSELLRSSLDEALKALDAAEHEAMREVEKVRRDYAMRAEAARARVLGMAEIEARSQLLRLLDEKANEIARAALDRIAEMKRDSSYEKVAEALLREAAAAVGSKRIIVKPARPDVAVFKKLLGRSKSKRFGDVELELSQEHVESAGGLIAVSGDGAVSYDNTFEARLARSMESVKRIIAEAAKGEG